MGGAQGWWGANHNQPLVVAATRSTLLCLLMLLAALRESSCWPEGTFGLPMPKTSCPHGSFVEWETGTRTQLTERGSHASENIHLAGVESSPAEHVVQLFCMKMSYPQDGDYHWMPGKYCIFKKGECPTRFQEGYILWDDAASYFTTDARQSFKGVLPDGDFGHNTKIFYCCRADGAAHVPIVLPSTAPFFLLKFGDACQEVQDMQVSEEWVHWADETNANIDDQSGAHPKMMRATRFNVYTKLFYCYYVPKPPSQTKQVLLLIIYIAAGLVAAATILSFLACVVKAICRRRRGKGSPAPEGGDSSPPEPLLFSRSITQSTAPPTVFRYVSVSNGDDLTAPKLVPSAPLLTPTAPILTPTSPEPLSANHPHPVAPIFPSAVTLGCVVEGVGVGGDGRAYAERLGGVGCPAGCVELRGGAIGLGCQRAPSCMCERCVSMPPAYEEVIGLVSGPC